MKLQKIEDFEMWKKAEAFCVAVDAILKRPGFVKDFKLRTQIGDAIDSILSNMSEGFEQPTDKAFANYLYTSKGSTSEACTRLQRGARRGYLTKTELIDFTNQGSEIRRLTTGLIKHLMKTPNRRRGLGPTSNEDPGA